MPFYNHPLEGIFMSVPCEVAVKCVLPVVRAVVARELTVRYQLKQVEAARLLGVSQPAVSLYHRNMRGGSIDLEKDSFIRDLAAKIAESLVKGSLSRKELILKYCEICKAIRAKGLLCDLHKAFDSAIDTEKCKLCYNAHSSSIKCL
jgi:predicted transcriptional regulator